MAGSCSAASAEMQGPSTLHPEPGRGALSSPLGTPTSPEIPILSLHRSLSAGTEQNVHVAQLRHHPVFHGSRTHTMASVISPRPTAPTP